MIMKKSADEIEKEKWLAIRRKAGRKIDPETAEVTWIFAYDFDPYGVDPELPEELRVVSRNYFARAPGSDIWVCFNDLPIATAHALWKKHKASLAFPAGLPPSKDDTTVVSRDSNGNCVVQLGESTLQQVAKEVEQMAKQAQQITYGYICQADARRCGPGKQKPTA